MHVGHIIVIGAMKAGTTTLYHLLSQHRQIMTSFDNGYRSPKELDYFLYNRNRSYNYFFRRRLLSRTWTLEASPNYTKTHMANGCETRIASLPKRTRLIYILRDPIERIDSHIAHNLHIGRDVNGEKAARRLIDISQYWKHIQRFAEAGLSDSLLLLDFDDLCRKPVDAVRRIHEFVGIPFEEPTDVRALNVRQKKGRHLTEDEERRYWAAMRPDVEALAESGRFDRARGWLENWTSKYG
ncbi:sulfotransferase domain-containing protein [Mycoplana dimorpha]|nr:sulfotransferase domain-containing protein [Mycoplana dimorpha]